MAARIPSFRLHKPSGQAVVRLNGRDFYLGRHDTPASTRRYEQLVSEWLARGRTLPTVPEPTATSGPTGATLLLAYKDYGLTYYRDPDGKPTTETNRRISKIRRAFKWGVPRGLVPPFGFPDDQGGRGPQGPPVGGL